MSLINEKPATASCTKSGPDVSTAQPQTYPGEFEHLSFIFDRLAPSSR